MVCNPIDYLWIGYVISPSLYIVRLELLELVMITMLR